MSDDQMKNIFGGRVRVRIMGILIREEKILVVNHHGLTESNEFWSPPGGGLDFGEGVIDCLTREFWEEVRLKVEVGEFLFGNEFITESFHAIELFYKVDDFKGHVQVGSDPEMGDGQIIKAAKWMSLKEIKKMGAGSFHEVFGRVQTIDELTDKHSVFYLRNIH